MQALLERYSVEVGFTRKIIFFRKIHSLKSGDLPYAGAKNYWDKYLRAWLRVQEEFRREKFKGKSR